MLYIMSFDIQSKEIPPTSFLVQTRQVRVGRHTDNDLVLHDTSVSRKHAILIRNNDAILVRDLGSKNGITINGHPLTQGLLRDQEILTLGEVILRLNVCKAPNSAARTGSIPSPTAASSV
jgi:pSer/pThr/pTyr-binding forkhead associated (FHA) protein